MFGSGKKCPDNRIHTARNVRTHIEGLSYQIKHKRFSALELLTDFLKVGVQSNADKGKDEGPVFKLIQCTVNRRNSSGTGQRKHYKGCEKGCRKEPENELWQALPDFRKAYPIVIITLFHMSREKYCYRKSNESDQDILD